MRHEPRNRKRRICAALLWLALLPVLAAGCGQGQTGSATSGPPAPEVAAVTVKTERVVLTTDLSGRTAAYSIAEIRPQVSGIIQKRLFEEGAQIEAGQPLYQIDPASLQAAYDNAAANVAVARRAAERARAAVAASRAGVVRQRAVLENAQTNRKRFEALLADGAVSASQRDQAATEADVAEATLRTVEAQVESDLESVAAAEAAIQQAQAALETTRISLGYARVTSPIAGRVGKSNVTVGALVMAGQATPLATVQRLDPIYVDVTQSSANLLQLRRNIEAGRITGGPDRAPVKLVLEDGTPYPLEGTLKFSEVTVDPTTGSYTLRMVFPNPRQLLLPGMYVRTIVQEGVLEEGILVPQQAVSRNPKGNPVALVVGASDKVEQRILALDRAIGDKWLVADGLRAGDRLIVEGVQRVRAGSEVKVVPFAPAQPAAQAK